MSPVGTFGSDLTVELTPWIDYELLINMTFLNEQSGLYQHHIVSTLSTGLVGDIDLDVGSIWERAEKPQERANGTFPEKDDFRLLVSIDYEF